MKWEQGYRRGLRRMDDRKFYTACRANIQTSRQGRGYVQGLAKRQAELCWEIACDGGRERVYLKALWDVKQQEQKDALIRN